MSIATTAPPGAVENDGRIRFSGIFDSPALEDEFRRSRAQDERWMIRFCLLVTAAGTVMFVPNDVHLFGYGPQFFELFGIRLVNLLALLTVWLCLPRCQSPAAVDRLLVASCVVSGLFHLYVISTRPPHYVGHTILTVLNVLMLYCIAPMPLVTQAVLAVLLSAGNFILMMHAGISSDGLTPSALVGACASANVVGAMASWRLNHRQRLIFLAIRRETELRMRLEQALAAVRTLRGYLSICAWCKRIRDEKEDWHSLESFVQARTHAQFTHAICPKCFHDHFGEDPESVNSSAVPLVPT